MNQRANLPAHEVGEGEEKAKRKHRTRLTGEGDAEDKSKHQDHPGKCAPGRRGRNAERRNQEAERGNAEHLGKQRRSLFAGYIDDGGKRVQVQAVLRHSYLRKAPEGLIFMIRAPEPAVDPCARVLERSPGRLTAVNVK